MSFDFDDTPKPWTIKSLNARLKLLQIGETLRIEDLPNKIYHGVIGVSCSKLKVFIDDCPFMYKATFIDKLVPFVHKSYFDFGSAGHTTILEPHKFDAEYCKMPDYSGEGSVAKKDLFKLNAEKRGQTVLSEVFYNAMPKLRAAIDADPAAKALTSNGVAEVSYFKRDEETELIIKCRPDYMINDLIVDLKTSDTVNPKYVAGKFSKLQYDIQDAMYCDVVGVDSFVFVAIQSAPPYMVTAPIMFDEQKRRLAHLKYRKALKDLALCMKENEWKAYDPNTLEGYFVIGFNKFDEYELEKLESNNE
jgi:hypothetical protein